MLSQARSLNGRITPFASCDQPSAPDVRNAGGPSMSQRPTSFTTTRRPFTPCGGTPRRQSKEIPDFFRMWAASRPISRRATPEYRPSGITTAVTWVDRWDDKWVDGWPARLCAAHKIKVSTERTWLSFTNPSTKRLELTRLPGDYTRNNGPL